MAVEIKRLQPWLVYPNLARVRLKLDRMMLLLLLFSLPSLLKFTTFLVSKLLMLRQEILSVSNIQPLGRLGLLRKDRSDILLKTFGGRFI
jgi:hypothetical protein